MKDALGHGSDARGAHAAGVNAVGQQWSKNKQKNLEVAQRIAEGLGYKAEVVKSVGSGVAYYNEGRGISLNSNSKFWRDPVGSAARAINLSTNEPEHVLHHEIGHALYDAPSNWSGDFIHQQDVARSQVSKYAATNPKEFVSEVHAGMALGKTYSPEVMQMFRNYARPRK